MKTFGKLLVLIGIGLPIIAILTCKGWGWPTFLEKVNYAYVELVPERTTPDIVHRDKVGYNDTLAAIESSAFEAYPYVENTNSTIVRVSGSLLDLDFGPSDDDKRKAFIRDRLIEHGLLTPEVKFVGLRVKVRTVFVLGLFMTLTGIFIVWK